MDFLDLVESQDFPAQLLLQLGNRLLLEINDQPQIITEFVPDGQHVDIDKIEKGKNKDR